MKKIFKFRVFGILFISIVTGIFAVMASESSSISISQIDTSSFPLVKLKMSIRENGTAIQNLSGKQFTLTEKGEPLATPLVVIPPGASSNKIDLYLLLDKSAKTLRYRTMVMANIKALIRALKDGGVDLQVRIGVIGGDSRDADMNLALLDTGVNLETSLEGIQYDTLPRAKIYGLTHLYWMGVDPSRSGAQKIAVVVNGSPFYDKDNGDSSNYGLRETIQSLYGANFITFVIGQPFRQFQAFGNAKNENTSLSQSLPGGYLGDFSTDLTRIHDLLKNRSSTEYTMQYFSGLKPSEASNASVGIETQTAGAPSTQSFSYPAISTEKPILEYTPPAQILYGQDFVLELKIKTNRNFIGAVKLGFSNAVDGWEERFLMHTPQTDTEGLQTYAITLKANQLPKDFLFYEFKIHSPYHVSGNDEYRYTVPMAEYDAGIQLTSSVANNNEVIWRWSGTTVDQGEKYQIWAGDQMIKETSERVYTIPVTECNRYQIVKVRVLLRANATHERKGTWSLFSLPGEHYVGSAGTMEEKAVIEKFLECLQKKSFSSVADATRSVAIYSPASKANLDKTLFYLSRLRGVDGIKDLNIARYRFIYFFMRLIGQTDLQTYKFAGTAIDRSIVYKLITGANQTQDFTASFKTAIDLMVQKMRGIPTL